MPKISQQLLIREIIQKNILVVADSLDETTWTLLKNGQRTPIFLDASKFISYPDLLDKINHFAIEKITEARLQFDRIMGLPYGGLSFSYGIARLLNVPSIATRKEGPKSYGTKGELLGVFNENEEILLIEDAIVTAATAIEFIEKLRKHNLVVKDIVAVIDAGVGGRENLEKLGVRMQALFTWKNLVKFFLSEKPDFPKDIARLLQEKFEI